VTRSKGELQTNQQRSERTGLLRPVSTHVVDYDMRRTANVSDHEYTRYARNDNHTENMPETFGNRGPQRKCIGLVL